MSLMEHWRGCPSKGAGRIKRLNAYRMQFGSLTVDIDEVRNHHFPRLLIEETAKWRQKPTAVEVMWLCTWITGYLPGTQDEFMNDLFEMVGGETERQQPIVENVTRRAS